MRISNGKTALNVWEMVYDDDELTELTFYNGNDQNAEFEVYIFNGSSGTATGAISNIHTGC